MADVKISALPDATSANGSDELPIIQGGVTKRLTIAELLALVTAYVPGGTDVAVADGGTGASTASGARTNLGLVIGTNVQAWDATLDVWANKTVPSGAVVGISDTQTLSNKTFVAPALGTPASGNLSNCTNIPSAQISGVIPIANLATGTPNGSKFIRDDGTLQAIAGGGDALVANPLSQFAATTSAQLASVITNETGSGSLVFGTAPTISALTATGITTYDGASVTTANAMGALSIDTSKGLNTKSISADSTFTFSAEPATNTWFAMYLANTDTAPHIITVPTVFSQVTQANRTTFPIAASGQLYLVFRHSGSGNYKIFGDSAFFNKFDATTAPGVGDDVADGYGLGSLWYDATANSLYFCESNGAGAAVWTLLGGAGDVTLTGTQTLTNKQIHLAAIPGTDDTYQGQAITGRNAGATIAQWEAVYLGSGGTWLLADADGSSTQPARGLAVAAYTSGNAAVVLDNGVARNDAWAWTVGGDIYLSTTAGGLTQTAPVIGFVQKMGYALSADTMRVAIGSSEILGL